RGGDVSAVAAHIVDGVRRLLGVHGVAVGMLEDGVYRVLAADGVDATYRARYDGRLQKSPVARALTTQQPIALREPEAPDAPGVRVRTLAFPFTGVEIAGALHVIVPLDTVLPPEELALARALTLPAAGALMGARQCERLARTARLKSDALAAMAHDLRAPLN